MKRLIWLGGLAAALLIFAMVWLRAVPDDPGTWHLDPAVTERTGRDNDFLMAPTGTVAAEIDTVAEVKAVAPKDLLFQFDAIARNASRTAVVAGSVDEGMITYVQRSAVLGFPDYITVKAVEAGDGAGLIVWSRSRYGYSDMGVNRARIEGWLAQVGG